MRVYAFLASPNLFPRTSHRHLTRPPYHTCMQTTPEYVASTGTRSTGRKTADVIIPYACPRCKSPAEPTTRRQCYKCGTPFPMLDGILEMLPQDNSPVAPPLLSILRQAPRQLIFQIPLVSYAYERGWRSQFCGSGFPGVDGEYELLESFFFDESDILEVSHAHARDNGGASNESQRMRGQAERKLVLDLSCGSGLMSRRLATSDRFSRVIASDYSMSMMQETYRRAVESKISLELIRADVAHLPFQTESIPYAHAGAAMHCWPRLQDSLAELYRVLEPGGQFFGTTFLKGALPSFLRNLDLTPQARKAVSDLIDEFMMSSNTFRYFEVDELLWLLKGAGFQTQVEARDQCAIIRCTKRRA